MSSFKRKTGSKSELPTGTKSSPSSPTTLLTSTGIPSLDDILGGGLPISCSLLILAPDAHSAYGQLVQNYFIAQGLAGGQTVYVIDDNPNRMIDDCMWFPATDSVAYQKLGPKQDETIKIAWRYETMRPFQTTVDVASNHSSMDEYCKAFDLTCRIPRFVVDNAIESKQIVVLDLETVSEKSMITHYVIEQITYICETLGSSSKPLRICIPSLGAPVWGESRPQDILYFLHALRRILRRYSNICATICLSPHVTTDAWGGPGWTQKLGWAVDAAITLAAFTANPFLSALFPSHHGFVHIHGLPTPHTILTPSDKFSTLRGLSSSSSLVSSGGGENNLAFKCMRKRMLFETLHLDLEGGVGDRRTTPATNALTPERNRETGKAEAAIKVMIEEEKKSDQPVSTRLQVTARSRGTVSTLTDSLFQSSSARSDGLDIRNHDSTALPATTISQGKPSHYHWPQAPTPTLLPSLLSNDMWSPDQASLESETEESISPLSDYIIDSPTLSMVSSPSTILGSSGFNHSPSSHTDSLPSDFVHSRSLSHSRSTAAHLPPEPSQLSDSYTFRHPHQQLVPPPLSSADSSSVSTRSSGYTNSGSAIASMDYSHVHVASGDDDQSVGVGITSDDVVQLLEQDASTSAISSSRAPVDQTRWSQLYSGNARSRSSSIADSRSNSVALSLNSKPSFDTVWRTLDERDEAGLTSEDETDEDPSIDEVNEDEHDQEEQPTSAMVIAEEGRGIIVRGDDVPIVQLQAQPGTTHLLIGSATTPNVVPAFLANTLPQICDTLLALDVSANFLGALSPALACCENLEELNIASNPLRALPLFLCKLTSLRVLIADATGINTLPEPLVALERVHTLSLRRNKMNSLPSWLCILPALETLLVDGNPFQGPWKALVDPLLIRIPSSPFYPLSTPVFPPPSASTQGWTTGGSETDGEYLSDSPKPDGDVGNYALPEDDTITPARMHLGRAATSPYPVESPPPRPTGSLTRNHTTGHRTYYEKGRRTTVSNPKQEVQSQKEWSDPGYSADREVRRMKSAGELRDGPPPARSSRPGTTFSPKRPSLSQYATSLSGTNLLAASSSPPAGDSNFDPKRFASLGVAASPTRISSNNARPGLSTSIWDSLPLDEEPEKSITSPPPHRKSLVKTPPASPPGRTRTQDPDVEISGGPSRKEEKERSSRWGFLKKMSMGKMRLDASSSRPSSSQGGQPTGSAIKPGLRPAPRAHSGSNPPLIDVRISTTGSLDAPPQQHTSNQIRLVGLAHKASQDALKPLPQPSNTINSSDHLALPSSPVSTSRASKRRSFLPIDLLPIAHPSSFVTSTTITDEGDEISDDARATPSPGPTLVESFEHIQRREEERAREAYTRALRSVMAYLRDMHDLGLSQTNVMSMYGSPTDIANSASGSRRPTTVESNRSMSDSSLTSLSTADSNGQLRSVDSRAGLRSGGEAMTHSVMTMDSTGSGNSEERKTRDDKGKRARIVREIVETERTYVKGLQELVDIYIMPASAPVNVLTGVGKETVIPAPERKIVFGGLESLFSFHKESFLPALEAAAAPLMRPAEELGEADHDGKLSLNVARTVANSFVSHAAFMRMYSSYINNFDNAVQRVKYWMTDRPQTPNSTLSPSSSTAQLVGLGITMSAISTPAMAAESASSNGIAVYLSSSQKKRIKSYLKRCRMSPRHSQLNLEGYLLLPVQRIPRYRMMLEELVKSSSSLENYAATDSIERALLEISSLATNMNEGKRDAESRRKLVQWQSRIRGKFPSPLVQPHRRLIMDGHLSLTRVVRKACVAFEVIDSHGDASTVQVDCLAPEMTPRALIGILCNDLLVLCRDPSQGQEPNSPVDLWAVLRMQTVPQPASIVHGNALRLVDNKAVLYFDAPSTSDALNWYRAINLHIPASKT